MNTGRALLLWATDAPRSIGRTGNVHGAATVSVPASRAKITVSIGIHRFLAPHRGTDLPFGRTLSFVTIGTSRSCELAVKPSGLAKWGEPAKRSRAADGYFVISSFFMESLPMASFLIKSLLIKSFLIKS